MASCIGSWVRVRARTAVSGSALLASGVVWLVVFFVLHRSLSTMGSNERGAHPNTGCAALVALDTTSTENGASGKVGQKCTL